MRAREIALMFDDAKALKNSPGESVTDVGVNTEGGDDSQGGKFAFISNIPGVFGYRSSRGFLTYTGRFKKTPISVVSIGMGYPNMDFFVREVRAIVSGPLVIVRVGTCGAIKDGHIGMLSIPDLGAVMVQRNYDYPFSFSNSSLETLPGTACEEMDQPHCIPETACKEMDQPYRISRPYLPNQELCNSIIREAINQIGMDNVLRGMHASADSFYSSQGRPSCGFLDLNEGLLIHLLNRGVKTIEMETGQLFHLASCLKDPMNCSIQAGAIHVIVADRQSNHFLTNLKERTRLDRLAALIALEALVSIQIDPYFLSQVTVVTSI